MTDEPPELMTAEKVLDPAWRATEPAFYGNFNSEETRAKVRKMWLQTFRDEGVTQPCWISIVEHSERGMSRCSTLLFPKERVALVRETVVHPGSISRRAVPGDRVLFVEQPPRLFCPDCSAPYEEIITLLCVPEHGRITDSLGFQW